jgi:hypothetical protein
MNTIKHHEKPFGFNWDPTSKCMVWEIRKIDGLFPLLIKLPFEDAKTYELVLTQNQKLNLR